MCSSDLREDLLRSAVDEFARQTYARRELIVVDDGVSAPRVLPEADEVRYFRLPRGLTATRKLNYGFQQARGTLFAYWDDAARYAPERLERQVRALSGGKSDVALLGGVRRTFLLRADAWAPGEDWEAFVDGLAGRCVELPKAGMVTVRRGGRKRARPLVSCIMPTANRHRFVPHAIRLFQSQDYPNREIGRAHV